MLLYSVKGLEHDKGALKDLISPRANSCKNYGVCSKAAFQEPLTGSGIGNVPGANKASIHRTTVISGITATVTPIT